MNNDYVKIVYESSPIGKEKIILRLTTFDIERFNEDEKLKKIPIQRENILIDIEKKDLNNPNFIYNMGNYLNNIVNEKYKQQIEQMKQEIEHLKSIKIVPVEYSNEKNVKNISNSDDVHCNIVYGNITNCDNIYCKEIKGNVVNCDKIIYGDR